MPEFTTEDLRTAPSLAVSTRYSPLYDTVGSGYTDRVCLMGHADGIDLGYPIKVTDIREMMETMGNDETSPLLRAMLQAYYSGARDIWVMAIDRMEHYEPDLLARTQTATPGTYYARHKAKLTEAYEHLLKSDPYKIYVPVDAPFNTVDTDFLTQLVSFTQDMMVENSIFALGILGTRGELTPELANAMLVDGRLQNGTPYGDAGRSVCVVAGEGLSNMSEIPFTLNGGMEAAAAGALASQGFKQGLTNTPLRAITDYVGQDLDEGLIDDLADIGINCARRTIQARRFVREGVGPTTGRVVVNSDNTISTTGSYPNIQVSRLVSQINSEVRMLAQARIGRTGFNELLNDIRGYLHNLMAQEVLRSYDLLGQRSDRHTYVIHLSLHPYTTMRKIDVAIDVGPLNGGVSR